MRENPLFYIIEWHISWTAWFEIVFIGLKGWEHDLKFFANSSSILRKYYRVIKELPSFYVKNIMSSYVILWHLMPFYVIHMTYLASNYIPWHFKGVAYKNLAQKMREVKNKKWTFWRFCTYNYTILENTKVKKGKQDWRKWLWWRKRNVLRIDFYYQWEG